MLTVAPLAGEEVAAAKALLDECFGAGFEEIDPEDVAFAAHLDSRFVGVLTVAARPPALLEAHYAGRVTWPGDSLAQPEVALIRQIGVAIEARGAGVGDALMTAAQPVLSGWAVANAWVHACTGHCPAGPLLERHGFAVAGYVPDFFAAMPSADCPGCGEAPCRCSVRVYVRGGASPQPK
jgi:hypothetical protein